MTLNLNWLNTFFITEKKRRATGGVYAKKRKAVDERWQNQIRGDAFDVPLVIQIQFILKDLDLEELVKLAFENAKVGR